MFDVAVGVGFVVGEVDVVGGLFLLVASGFVGLEHVDLVGDSVLHVAVALVRFGDVAEEMEELVEQGDVGVVPDAGVEMSFSNPGGGELISFGVGELGVGGGSTQQRRRTEQVVEGLLGGEDRPVSFEEFGDFGAFLDAGPDVFESAEPWLERIVDERVDDRLAERTGAGVVGRPPLGGFEQSDEHVGLDSETPAPVPGDERLGRFASSIEHGSCEQRRHPGVALEGRHLGIGVFGESDAWVQLGRRHRDHAAFAERRQDVGDPQQELGRRADDQDAGLGEGGAVGVEQVGGPVEGDDGLPGTGPALNEERTLGRRSHDRVLLGLDRGDDGLHAIVGAPPQGSQQGGLAAELAQVVERVGVEHLVAEVGQLTLIPVEVSPVGHAEGFECGGSVEGFGGGCAPVDEQDFVAFDHGHAPDVDRLVRVGGQPSRGCGLLARDAPEGFGLASAFELSNPLVREDRSGGGGAGRRRLGRGFDVFVARFGLGLTRAFFGQGRRLGGESLGKAARPFDLSSVRVQNALSGVSLDREFGSGHGASLADRDADSSRASSGQHTARMSNISDLTIGFIGLGNVGGKLAGSLVRNGLDVIVRDLDADAAQPLLDAGARFGDSPKAMAQECDVVITCLPSPAASAAVLEADDGLLAGFGPGKVWMEMSTTDQAEVTRLGAKVAETGAEPVDCPVSGGCHRAATGNIAIFAGCERATFEKILPILTTLGRRVLHTGELGSASVLKVMTNYLATANLLTLCEALVTSKAAGLDLNTTYEAIRISSGNSFVHETESQVILNGSRDINFTMDLVQKDIGLFQSIADRHDVPLEISPVLIDIFDDGAERFGPREWSPNIIKRLEEATGLSILAPGFPAEMVDDEPEEPGYEVIPKGVDR